MTAFEAALVELLGAVLAHDAALPPESRVLGDADVATDLAADLSLVAADLRTDERQARWWRARAPGSRCASGRLGVLVRRKEREAKLGPGYARRVKGQEVRWSRQFDATYPARSSNPHSDPQRRTANRDLIERVWRLATPAAQRAVTRRASGKPLTGADRKALCLLRRKLRRLGLQAAWLTS